jgi:hypothetical protein
MYSGIWSQEFRKKNKFMSAVNELENNIEMLIHKVRKETVVEEFEH